jgi:uncharacterized protein (DUF4415 family)
MIDETPKVKRGRGKAKKPALEITSLRLAPETLQFFREHYPTRLQAKMREVLANYVKEQKEIQNEHELHQQ